MSPKGLRPTKYAGTVVACKQANRRSGGGRAARELVPHESCGQQVAIGLIERHNRSLFHERIAKAFTPNRLSGFIEFGEKAAVIRWVLFCQKTFVKFDRAFEYAGESKVPARVNSN